MHSSLPVCVSGRQVATGGKFSTHRPSVDHQKGFGGAVKGAGGQSVSSARNNVAQVVVRVGRFPEGESGSSLVAVIPAVQQVFEGVQEVT